MFQKALQISGIANKLRVTFSRNLAVAYEQSDNPDFAYKYYNEAAAMATDNNPLMHHICKAEAFMVAGNIANAIENLNIAYEMNNDSFIANNNLGLIYLGSYGVEFQNLEKALKHNLKSWELQKDVSTQSVLGKNYFILKEYEKAEYYYSGVLEVIPDHPEFHYYLGLIKYNLGKKTEAANHLQFALKANPMYQTEEVINILKE